MTSFKQLYLKSLHPLIRSSQPRPTFFFFSFFFPEREREMDENAPDRKSNFRATVNGLAGICAPSSFSLNITVSARLTRGTLGEIMELTRSPQRDFIHLILEMLARRHRDNARLFGPSGGISLVTNQTDRAVQVPKTSVIAFGVRRGMYVCY